MLEDKYPRTLHLVDFLFFAQKETLPLVAIQYSKLKYIVLHINTT